MSDDERVIEQVKADIRQNYEFGLFSILPGLTDDFPTLQSHAKKIGISAEMADHFAFRLIQAGLWKVQGNKLESNFDLLDLGDISIKDYMSMTVSLISQLSDEKSYEYDTLSVVTNRALIKTFIHKVNHALKDLHRQSQEPGVEKDSVFSWTHTGVIEIEKKSAPVKNKDSDE